MQISRRAREKSSFWFPRGCRKERRNCVRLFCCCLFLCTTGDASPCSTRRSLAGSPKKPWETDNSVCGSALFSGVAANDLFRAGVNSVPVNAPWERCNPPGGNAATTTQRKTIQE